MLSIGKLGNPDYYLAMVADGLEEYYTNAREAPGLWMGRSAERLGLSGKVDGEALHRVLDHREPQFGTRLTRAQGAPKVPGFDATFCAPLSRIPDNGGYAESALMPSRRLVSAVVAGQRVVMAA